jgi:RimJ/RimL family protein N-acetyltransferase
LEALDVNRHLKKVFAATSGDMYFYKKRYEASEVWGFMEDGPFENEEQLRKSFVFQHYENQAAFAIMQNVTDHLLGVIMLSKDDPSNLSIQLDPPIVGPSSFGGIEQLEACFLLMDRLFANGYRRIQFSVDAKDSQSAKLADRLGFTLEGVLLKEMVIKESSRDSNVYGMLNSDWDKGARVALYNKLYGVAMTRADMEYNKKEEELDEQQRVLAEKKMEEMQKAGKKA